MSSIILEAPSLVALDPAPISPDRISPEHPRHGANF